MTTGVIVAQRETRAPFGVRILRMPHESDRIQLNRFSFNRFDTAGAEGNQVRSCEFA